MPKLQLAVLFPRQREPKLLLLADYASAKQSESPVYLLTPPLPSDQAYSLYQQGKSKLQISANLLKKIPHPQWQLLLIMKQMKIKYSGFPQSMEEITSLGLIPTFEELEQILSAAQKLLAGRMLPETAVFDKLRRDGWWPSIITQALDYGYNHKQLEFLPGVTQVAWGEQKCSRCNSVIVEYRPCWSCGRTECAVCLECESLGALHGCDRLWFWSKHSKSQPETIDCNVILHLDFPLSAAQQKASDRLVKLLASNDRNTLVWAACGAGKTEVVYQAIQTVLQKGEQVLFAVPRRDVVRELAARLKVAFPNTVVAEHYGGMPWDSEGQLVAATTHQVLRFYRRFALVVLDEVDAFPYQGNEMLRFGMERARMPETKMIEMTATPTRLPRKGQLVTIPARYHGHPLPEPQILKQNLSDINELKTKLLPDQIIRILQESDTPWLVFVPTRQSTQIVAECLSRSIDRAICYCHAQDPQRDHKRDGLESGKYSIMVATSIMERGITIPNVQVMILYADHPVFETNSLIQMAGRVGRKADYPSGQVWYIGKEKTHEMKIAAKRIHDLNEQARTSSLLRKEYL